MYTNIGGVTARARGVYGQEHLRLPMRLRVSGRFSVELLNLFLQWLNSAFEILNGDNKRRYLCKLNVDPVVSEDPYAIKTGYDVLIETIASQH